MITFDALTLKAFLDEKNSFLNGARINKIQQPTRREIVFTLRNNGLSQFLYVNIDPKFYHVCMADSESLKKRMVEYPAQPPMFCMLLRKYLENSKILKVIQPDYERILEIHAQCYNELGEKTNLCLAIELMGKYSNAILYNKDTGIIIGCAHNVGADKSRTREIYGGLSYIYPPKQQKIDILTYNGIINLKNIHNEFYMLSEYTAGLCSGVELQTIKDMIELKNIKPAITCDYSEYSLFGYLLKNEKIWPDSVNAMIDSYYSHHIYNLKFNEKKKKFISLVNHKLNKQKKSLAAMQAQLGNETLNDKYRLYGDLLMANLYQLKDFSSSVQVYDYENEKEIVIELDKTKTIKENANKFYKKYNKLKLAGEKLSELIEKSKIQLCYLEDLLYSLENVSDIEDLIDIAEELDSAGEKKKLKKSDIKCIEESDGTRIYIGKNNKQNDYIISKLASDDDLWFHVHNNSGSHVLLKTQNLTDDLIFRCAKLAKEYSSVRNSSKIGVIYTKRKYLRKPPGANLGYVTYRNEKEIILD